VPIALYPPHSPFLQWSEDESFPTRRRTNEDVLEELDNSRRERLDSSSKSKARRRRREHSKDNFYGSDDEGAFEDQRCSAVRGRRTPVEPAPELSREQWQAANKASREAMERPTSKASFGRGTKKKPASKAP